MTVTVTRDMQDAAAEALHRYELTCQGLAFDAPGYESLGEPAKRRYRDIANQAIKGLVRSDAFTNLLAQAWEEGLKAGWQASGEGWNGEYPGKEWTAMRDRLDIANPYRREARECSR